MYIDINGALEEIKERLAKTEKLTKKFIKKNKKQMKKINALVRAVTNQNKINRAILDVPAAPKNQVELDKAGLELNKSIVSGVKSAGTVMLDVPGTPDIRINTQKISIHEDKVDSRSQQMSREKATRKSSLNIKDIMSSTTASIQESLKNPVEINETPYVDPVVPGERPKSDAEMQKAQDDLMATLRDAVAQATAASKEPQPEVQESWEDDEE